jgi:hypothetical protein
MHWCGLYFSLNYQIKDMKIIHFDPTAQFCLALIESSNMLIFVHCAENKIKLKTRTKNVKKNKNFKKFTILQLWSKWSIWYLHLHLLICMTNNDTRKLYNLSWTKKLYKLFTVQWFFPVQWFFSFMLKAKKWKEHEMWCWTIQW